MAAPLAPSRIPPIAPPSNAAPTLLVLNDPPGIFPLILAPAFALTALLTELTDAVTELVTLFLAADFKSNAILKS